jgi:hypothetical protein
MISRVGGPDVQDGLHRSVYIAIVPKFGLPPLLAWGTSVLALLGRI